jgi:division protein CdvB (Snf7/Vps24/ESCRT-III family)
VLGVVSMSSEFTSKWNKPRSEGGLGARIRESFRSPEPLRPKIEQASRQLQIQIAKLESTSTKLRERDASIFNKVVAYIQKHDTQHANMLANELAEVRKMSKMVTHAKLALGQIDLRLSTIRELGDIASTLSPAMGVLRGVRGGLSSIVPEAEGEIGEISSLLSDILVDAGQVSSTSIDFQTANEEAERVLAEAGAVAEQNMKEKFPDLPSSEDEFTKVAETE